MISDKIYIMINNSITKPVINNKYNKEGKLDKNYPYNICYHSSGVPKSKKLYDEKNDCMILRIQYQKGLF